MSGDAGFDVDVRLAIQHAFIAGRPTPTVASVAAELDVPAADVAAAFDRLATGHVIVLAPGTRDLVMSAPFAGRPTDFVVRVGERTHYANCVWDALGIAVILASTGRRADGDVRTTCADCGTPLALAVRDGDVHADPADAVAHFAVPAARWWADIGFT